MAATPSIVTLSPKVQKLKSILEDFVENECIPAEKIFEEQLGNAKKGTNGRFERYPPIIDELRAKAKSLGLFNMFLPNHYPGYPTPGLSNLEYGVLCEILGRSTTLAPLACNCNAPDTGTMEVLVKYGTDAQKKQWLDRMLRGEIHSAFLMTEPNQASSDATNISTRIEKDGKGNYVINGRKWWITNGNNPRTELYILVGKTAPDHPEKHRQQSIVLIPRHTPGITIVRNLTVFVNDAPIGHCEILLENVVVPVENIVLGEGRGFEVLQGRLGPGRIHHAMRAIGQAERALDKLVLEATNPVKRPFGQLKADFQKVQWDIATSRMEIDQARLLVFLAADMIDKKGAKGALREIAMAKVIVPNVLQRVIDRAVQVHGAAGVSGDHELAEMFANARTLRFVDGPDEVHTQQIAKLELRRGQKLHKAFDGYAARTKVLEQGKKL
ncbi:acyl-CoA dehydrogenase NM domain-like protein [Gonapodya prolifera JEL478]|uniref:Acyl-CoA dehydrogenase NM domain-like protein n=1 Tax=Gonapodya prolifera (strain JEL478) TaxID=1344416 RepID=A0A139B0G0_GONPJ|nr:acyl-CoA dehydrogenase NM domain-like protein [Gonapodya prolifera JEL478]|eukprot:KXS22459.1 acyl-CoA dehydrogenase NM domain-like protein [Gonapodya prolifera JEL478]